MSPLRYPLRYPLRGILDGSLMDPWWILDGSLPDWVELDSLIEWIDFLGKSSRSSSSNPVVRDSLSSGPIPSTSTASQASSSASHKLRLPTAGFPAGSDAEAKFTPPSRKSGSSKSRRRAATAAAAATADANSGSSVFSTASTTPSSSLSSLSSMAMSYPFFGNPLASLSLPLTSAPSAGDSITIEKKKSTSRKTVNISAIFTLKGF